MNRKQTVAARLPADLIARLERVAAEDRRTLSTATLMAIEAGLPLLELEVLGSSPVKAPAAVPEEVAS